MGDRPPPNPLRTAAAVLFVLVAAGLLLGRALDLTPFSWLETVAVVTGAGCVLLVVWRSVWNFPVGIVSCAAYFFYFHDGKLYADAGLQLVFITLGFHGWNAWLRGKADARPVRRVPLDELTVLAVLFSAVWLGLTRLLEHAGGAAPLQDAFVTTASIASQWLLNRRYVENWLGWIVVDQVSVVLYWSRDMHLTAGLYAVFLGMCVAGFIEWRRELRRETP